MEKDGDDDEVEDAELPIADNGHVPIRGHVYPGIDLNLNMHHWLQFVPLDDETKTWN